MKTHLLLAVLAFYITNESKADSGAAFSYQGLLKSLGAPANGAYEMSFLLYDAASGTNAISTKITVSPIHVSNGFFQVTLDFGSQPFRQQTPWLQIYVKRVESHESAIELTPRQRLLRSPAALHALEADAVLGPIPDTLLSSNVARLDGPQSFSGDIHFVKPFSVASSNKVSSLNADQLDGLDSTDFAPATHSHSGTYWSLSGNGQTAAGSDFLGTTDNQPLEIKVNGARALRLEPTTGSPNIVGGSSANYVATNSVGVTISGGGGNTLMNYVKPSLLLLSPDFATIGGGADNGVTGAYSTIGGGSGNRISRQRLSGSAEPVNCVIAGGVSNTIEGAFVCTIAGGGNNTIHSGFEPSSYNSIGGGAGNVVHGSMKHSCYSTIAGGIQNSINDGYSGTIGGGGGNRISSWCVGATISGGSGNDNAGTMSTIGGGINNLIAGLGDFGPETFGGTIGGGSRNRIELNATNATIAGGSDNTILGDAEGSAILGGVANKILDKGYCGSILGGRLNEAAANALAGGTGAKAIHKGSFVWADSQGGAFVSTATNEVSFRCGGGVRFASGTNGADQTVSWTPGSASWSFSSDRKLKENFSAVNSKTVLEKVNALPITEWSYKGHTDRHIGPMAQDFHAAFPLNDSETTLNTADLHGVTFAAIQGLHQLAKEKDGEIRELQKRISRLEALVSRLAENHIKTERDNGVAQ